MINAAEAKKRAQETLVGFPPRVTAAYVEFAEKGDLANLDVVVLGVLHFYLAKKPKESLDTLPGSTRLIEDLGCDSLTMMDTVFMVESLFDIKINDNELPNLATLDDLRRHLRQLVHGTPAPAT
ncbi:MAG TPA: acyl carrier protein [Opitutaceae bacterium]|nr:acyl carrier protein [Opitutaceae bacterium]